jgi:hypothetical protein
MKPRIWRLFNAILLLLICDVSWNVFCCNAYAQYAEQPVSKSQAAYRLTMTECEGVDNCTSWTFLSSNGWKGYGKWRTGEEAILELESARDGKIVVHRTDVTGSKEGLTATYNGTLHDNRIGGEFKASYQGHNESGNWYAVIGKAAVQGPPSVMHWCGQHCGTWTLDNGPPFDKPHYGSEALGSIVIVESFTPESVIMHRIDYRPYPGTADLTGQLSSDGNSIVNGTMRWTYHPCCGLTSGPYQAAWGAAINTVPANDAERAAQGTQQTQTAQITVRDVRDGVLEIKKWIDFFQLFTPSSDDH